jgi:hypothetical protein
MMSPDMRQVTPKLRYKFTEAASLYMTRDTKLKPYRLGREHNISNSIVVEWAWDAVIVSTEHIPSLGQQQ